MHTYKLIDHTADVGIRVFGKTLEDLFTGAGYAMFDLLVDKKRQNPGRQETVLVSGMDWPDLMVNWLRELFYLWIDHNLVASAIAITHINKFNITAVAEAVLFDSKHDEIIHDIKAVTYHGIEVKSVSDGWEAKIIFDV